MSAEAKRRSFGLSVRAVLTDERGHLLILRRASASRSYAGQWDLPGGAVEPGESFDAAICREVLEETGLTVTPAKVVGVDQGEVRGLMVVSLLIEVEFLGGQIGLSHEHSEHRWVGLEELASLHLCELYGEAVRRYAQGRLTARQGQDHV